MQARFLYFHILQSTAHKHLGRTIITTATRRAGWGVHSDSLNKALFGPLAQ